METIQPYEGREAYIFISYARKDKNRAFPFLKALHQAGYRIWYDAGIQAGDAWQDVIGSHIKNCGACLAFISAHSSASRYCKREIQYADNYKKSLIPFYLEEGVSLSPGLELIISGIQSLKLSECPTPEAFIERLKRSKTFRSCKGELHTRRREAERAERRERETRTQSANAQSELSASPEFLSVFAVNGDIPRPSETAAETGRNETVSVINGDIPRPSATTAETGTNETAVVVNGDIPRPSETAVGTGTKKARKPSPRIRTVHVNRNEIFSPGTTRKSLSVAKAMRLTFEAVLNDYLGVNPAPEKARTVEAFIRANPRFLRFEAVSHGQFARRKTLDVKGFPSPVYLATANDTPTKRKYVTRLYDFLEAAGQKSDIMWLTTDNHKWTWGDPVLFL